MSAELDSQVDLAYDICRHIERASFGDLDEETVLTTKLSLIDTVGVTLASTGLTPGVDAYLEVAEIRGGAPECSVVGFPNRLSAPNAAWLNGALVHGLDYDDLVRDVGYHPSTPTVPTALALAERSGRVDGRQLLTAIALGNDLGVRIAASVTNGGAWFGTPVFGVFAATATASKLLGLDAERTHAALGLAYIRAAGTLEMRWSANSNIASFNGGAPNETGVLSALLAERGAGGIENVFEGRGGLYPVYFGNDYDRREVLSDLGSYYRGVEASFKVWPACGGSHPAIDAALHVFGDNKIDPATVSEIVVATTGGTYGLCVPLEVRRHPPTPMDAKFSIPYSIAVAAVRGNVTLEDFAAERLQDEEIISLTEKITAVDDPSLAIRKAALPARITVTTTDGKKYEYRCDQPKGVWPHSRLTSDEIIDKFVVNAAYARTPVGEKAARAFAERVLNLEDDTDTASLLKELAE